jgi:hypothetical protein
MTNQLDEPIQALEATTEAVNPSPGLSVAEARTLGELEDTIAKGECSIFETGRALAKIRDEKLYRGASYRTFEAYCRGRWGFSRQRADQLIGAAETAKHLTTIVDTVSPTNESQVRSLVGRPLEEAVEIWKLANSMAAGTPVTGRLVKQAIKQLFGEPPMPVKPIADQLEGVLRSCRDLADHLAGTDLANLAPKLKAQLASIAEVVGELARKAQPCNAPAETAKRSKEELIKEARAFSRQRPRPPLNYSANLQPQK